MIYGVYSNSDLVHWSPAKIFQDEIKVSKFIDAEVANEPARITLLTRFTLYSSSYIRSLVHLRRLTAFHGPWPIWTAAKSELKEWSVGFAVVVSSCALTLKQPFL